MVETGDPKTRYQETGSPIPNNLVFRFNSSNRTGLFLLARNVQRTLRHGRRQIWNCFEVVAFFRRGEVERWRW
ncbi:hypothetical protein HanXRQr2_Chr15g0710331 [Helianthus annuus]|uniref:Uncharacterized protein n=1 Tax=Helianthus annuus TaxID=4232 RepID=A0A9K3H5Z1_HELAN|nr:hypothetical protein HanXRQr2_Chr15g0710331 [Helianthus annuus]